jgi:mono/diheme cytochrome c family protein
MKLKLIVLFLTVCALVSLSIWAIADTSDWQKKVPEADRAQKNPLAGDQSAVTAGAKLYFDKCSKCHGLNGEGKGSHPPLRTAKVHRATAGELQWLLTHGNRWRGMPAFGGLSDTERWQIVSFVQSMPADLN